MCMKIRLQPLFSLENVLLNVIVMTIGEFQFNDVFLKPNRSLDPFDFDVRLLLCAFCFLMTIVLMNLTVKLYFKSLGKLYSRMSMVIVRTCSVLFMIYSRNGECFLVTLTDDPIWCLEK